MPASQPDWLAICRDSFRSVRKALPALPERAAELGRGEGGDMTLAVDRAAEDAVLAVLERTGLPLTVITEEAGEVELAGGAGQVVVLDPVDGSLNAKRGLPFHAVSIAVADSRTMDSVVFGFVGDLHDQSEWWAERGGGAFANGTRLGPLEEGALEVVGLETAHPKRVAAASEMLRDLEANRLRTIGSVAESLCLVADGRLDGMLTLGPIRSVDAAAGQLLVTEAGGSVAFPDSDGAVDLGLEARYRVVAAATPALVDRLCGA